MSTTSKLRCFTLLPTKMQHCFFQHWRSQLTSIRTRSSILSPCNCVLVGLLAITLFSYPFQLKYYYLHPWKLGGAVVNWCDWTAFMIYYNPLQGLNTSPNNHKSINSPEIQEDDIFFANIIISKSRCLVLQVIYYLCALRTQQLSQRLE